ncbi:type IV pilin protein [Thermosulfuriphilus sp.]
MPGPGKEDRRGFTLIELLIVIAIVGIISMVAVPQLMKYKSRSAAGTATASLSACVRELLAAYTDSGQSSQTCSLPDGASCDLAIDLSTQTIQATTCNPTISGISLSCTINSGGQVDCQPNT